MCRHMRGHHTALKPLDGCGVVPGIDGLDRRTENSMTLCALYGKGMRLRLVHVAFRVTAISTLPCQCYLKRRIWDP